MAKASLISLHKMVKDDTDFNLRQRKAEKNGKAFKPLIVRTFTLSSGSVLGSPEGLEARVLTLRLKEKSRIASVLFKAKNKIISL